MLHPEQCYQYFIEKPELEILSFTRFIELYKLTMNELGTLAKRSSTTFTRFCGSITIDFLCCFIQAHTFSIVLKSGQCAGQFSLSIPFSCIYISTFLARCIGQLSPKNARPSFFNFWIPDCSKMFRYVAELHRFGQTLLPTQRKLALIGKNLLVPFSCRSRHHFLRVLRCLASSRCFSAAARPLNSSLLSVLLMVI